MSCLLIVLKKSSVFSLFPRMLLLKPFKFQNPMGKENGNGLLISLTSRSLLNTLQLGRELVMVDYCDSSFFGVRYRAVLFED